MNRSSLLLNGSLALLVLVSSTSMIANAGGSPVAVFGWIGAALGASALAVTAVAALGVSRRR